jgi:hypothetical protein
MIIPKSTELIEVKRASLNGLVDDLTKLDELNVPLIMHCLRERAKRKAIYTNVGTILISINPYELLPLYTPQVMDKYKRKGEGDVPPHPFAIADECYRSLFEEKKNQSILVSYVLVSWSSMGRITCTPPRVVSPLTVIAYPAVESPEPAKRKL